MHAHINTHINTHTYICVPVCVCQMLRFSESYIQSIFNSIYLQVKLIYFFLLLFFWRDFYYQMLISDTLIDVQCVPAKSTYSQFKRMSFISFQSLFAIATKRQTYAYARTNIKALQYLHLCCVDLRFQFNVVGCYFFFSLFNICFYSCYFPLSRVGAMKDISRSLVDSFESNVT